MWLREQMSDGMICKTTSHDRGRSTSPGQQQMFDAPCNELHMTSNTVNSTTFLFWRCARPCLRLPWPWQAAPLLDVLELQLQVQPRRSRASMRVMPLCSSRGTTSHQHSPLTCMVCWPKWC